MRTRTLCRLRSFCDKAGLSVRQVHWLSKMNATSIFSTGFSGRFSNICDVTRVPKSRLHCSLSGTDNELTLHLAIPNLEQFLPEFEEIVSGEMTTS